MLLLSPSSSHLGSLLACFRQPRTSIPCRVHRGERMYFFSHISCSQKGKRELSDVGRRYRCRRPNAKCFAHRSREFDREITRLGGPPPSETCQHQTQSSGRTTRFVYALCSVIPLRVRRPPCVVLCTLNYAFRLSTPRTASQRRGRTNAPKAQ